MRHKTFTASGDWVAYFYQNAQSAAALERPPATVGLPEGIRHIIARSLPAWQLGETSDGRHLRAAARQYALAHDDMAFLSAVDLFILEEQRHGAALGEWLDLVGIPRRKRDIGDSLFRMCRYAIPNYAVWASVVVMVESLAEIYYATVKKLSPCPRLATECARILSDEVRHIQFQCEHLALARRRLPRPVRAMISLAEAGFYVVVCTSVWLAHGALMKAAGMSASEFAAAAGRKLRFMQELTNPDRYHFPENRVRPPVWPVRIRE